MRVLVIGGAGYVGSHTVAELVDKGYCVDVVDDLSTGHARLVPDGVIIYQYDTYDPVFHNSVLLNGQYDVVMHFAAHSLVGESMQNPRKYFESNVSKGLRLLGACLDARVKYFIFSSSAAVYGEPTRVPIPESAPRLPTNPYGMTKLAIENALESYSLAYGLKFASLRYFNAAGAHQSGLIGEMHNPETHLIPNVLTSALTGRRIRLFGTDYPTSDGTAVRDYVHVSDLADAHILALEALVAGKHSGFYNLGSSTGFSVLEIIEAARRVTGEPLPVEECPRRPGDPPVLIADSTKARAELGWTPRYSDIEQIISTAWRWHKQGHT